MNRRGGRPLRILRAWGVVLMGVMTVGLGVSAQDVVIEVDAVRGMVDTLEVAQFLAKNILFSAQMEEIAAFGDMLIRVLEVPDGETEALIPAAVAILEQHPVAGILTEAANDGFESIIARVLLYLELAAAETRQVVSLARDRESLVDHRERACAFLFAAMGDATNPFVPDGLIDAIAMLPE